PPTVFSPFPYTTLFRSRPASPEQGALSDGHRVLRELAHVAGAAAGELPRERHRDDQEAAIFPAGPSHSAAVAANPRRRDCRTVCADTGSAVVAEGSRRVPGTARPAPAPPVRRRRAAVHQPARRAVLQRAACAV